MKAILSFLTLLSVKSFSHIFYRLECNWLSGSKRKLKGVRLAALIGHTSLYEPLFLQAVPVSFIWLLAKKMVAPGADITLKRPLVGFFWKLMGPGMVPITRKRDASWRNFLQLIGKDSVIIIAPEGRMMRENGLDKHGRPMSIRSGIAEIITAMDSGKIVLAHSGGLHHVQHPGDKLPRLFKKIKVNFEVLDIADYKQSFTSNNIQLRRDIVNDLTARHKSNKPN